VEPRAYYLIIRRKRGQDEIRFAIGSKKAHSVLFKLDGKAGEEIAHNLISVLSRYGALTPLEIGGKENTYVIREDIGPVIGAYLILVKRARDLKRWEKFLQELIEGEYAILGQTFASFLELAIELSKTFPQRREVSLSPIIVGALSGALKSFVKRLKTPD